MTVAPLRTLKRLFRSPATIVGELLFITVLGGLGAALPQTGVATAKEIAHLRTHGPFITALVEGLALDHVFTSPAFLAALAMATVSLLIVLVEQFKRLWSQWHQVPNEAHFRNAPFRHEFSRPSSAACAASPVIHTRGRLSLAGSPLFHTGLLCVILAGILRALFGVDAMVDLFEGETLPATTQAWGVQQPGFLAKPFHLDTPLILVSVRTTYYRSGDLGALRIKLAMPGAEGDQEREIGVNEELPMSRGRLYTDSRHGPTALVEWSVPATAPQRTALLLEKKEPQAFGAYDHGPGHLTARIRVAVPPDGQRPESAEVRILAGSSVLAEASLRPGQVLNLPGGGVLRLHGLPYWTRLHGNHDPALWLAYLGFALALLGATLTFMVVKVDELVSVSAEGNFERVVVAMRPHRFAPLFQERFQKLVREQGGQG